MQLLLAIGYLHAAALLAAIAVVAHRQRDRAAGSGAAGSSVAGSPVTGSSVAGSPVTDSSVAGSPVTDSSVAGSPVADEIEELIAHVEAVATAAEHAVAAAEEARQRMADAVGERDRAEDHYRQARQDAQEAAEPRLLVQRAAVNAYRRGQLSAAELNRVWQHIGTMPRESTRPVHEARRRYERAAAEAAQVRQEAHVTTVAVDVLVEEAEIAESHLSAALRSTDTGLALLRAG